MADIHFRDIQKGLRELGLHAESRVIVHTSLSAFGRVRGGAPAVVGALAAQCELVVVPAFTYQCMVRPMVGPPNNGMAYGDAYADNAAAEIFHPDLPAHPDMGVVAETLRRLPAQSGQPGAVRSGHPLLSFAAFGRAAERAMAAQTLAEPLGPIAHLAERDADVLLLGVGHTANTAIHYAEYRAGRKQFIRWALTPRGVVECAAWPGDSATPRGVVECAAWPGDSAGFDALLPHVASFARTVQIGQARAYRVPLRDLLRVAEDLIRADPAALLCRHAVCERCDAVRAGLADRLPQAAGAQ